MKALVGAFNQEKALVGAFSVIVQSVVELMDRFTALLLAHLLGRHTEGDGAQVHSLVRLDAGKNEKYPLKARFRGSSTNLNRYIPGPFAPPGSNLPILNITALSYS